MIPFRLKIAGATYQHLINATFRDQIKKTIEVYIDDMLFKSQIVADHIHHLEETFRIL